MKIFSKGEFVSNDETHSCVINEKKVQNIKIMNEIKDNISKNEIIYNVKPRELFESSIRKAIKRKKDNDPDESEIKKEDNHISIKTNQQQIFGNIKSSMYRFINPLASPEEEVSVFIYPYLSAGAPALGEVKGLIKNRG